MYCSGADVYGKIVSKEGEIGGWTIDTNSIHAENMYLSADGSITIKDGTDSPFWVNSSGILFARYTYAYRIGVVAANATNFNQTYGYLGLVTGWGGTVSKPVLTYNIGISSIDASIANSTGSYSVILESGKNIALRTTDKIDYSNPSNPKTLYHNTEGDIWVELADSGHFYLSTKTPDQ